MCSVYAALSAMISSLALAGWVTAGMTVSVIRGSPATTNNCRIWAAMISVLPTRRYSANSSTTNHAEGGSSRATTRRCRSILFASRARAISAVTVGCTEISALA